jgi:queuine tRNA-ribosyltransferase
MKNNQFQFRKLATVDNARAGILSTPHGELETPLFAPVGTQATVKAVSPDQLEKLGASLVLSNTYHLYLRPGADLIADFGGLHDFMGWKEPILTDSGGFQVYSLADARDVDDDGVTFKSYIDGSMHRFTPEKTIEIQEKLGADIIMAFDECAAPNDFNYCEDAMHRTHAWAERCIQAKTRSDQALFGIVQGGVFPELRKKSAEVIAEMDFPGNAIGGLSVGETKPEMHAMLEVVNSILPSDKPRYLMGVGSPEDLVNGVMRGVDIFDCVLPTRLARHKTAITSEGRLNLHNAVYSNDKAPIEYGCGCYTCKNFSRAYLRHLINSKEMLASTLLSIHNLYVLISLMQRVREAIFEGKFQEFSSRFLNNYKKSDIVNEKL